jgi:hypothetical protein
MAEAQVFRRFVLRDGKNAAGWGPYPAKRQRVCSSRSVALVNPKFDGMNQRKLDVRVELPQ